MINFILKIANLKAELLRKKEEAIKRKLNKTVNRPKDGEEKVISIITDIIYINICMYHYIYMYILHKFTNLQI